MKRRTWQIPEEGDGSKLCFDILMSIDALILQMVTNVTKNRIITVQNIPVTVSSWNTEDYICITDLATAKSGKARSADVIKNWLRNRMTIEYLGTWEQIYNPAFNVVEFDHFIQAAGKTGNHT